MKQILYLSVSISYTIGCNQLTKTKPTNNDSILIEWINQTILLLISILIGILSISLMIYYHYQRPNQTSIELFEEENLSNKKSIIRNIPELPHLLTIKPYVVYFLHRDTSPLMLHEIITEAKRTKRFTIVPKYESLYHDTTAIHIELVQQTHTILILIDSFDDKDTRTPFCDTLCQLFSIIFHPSNTVQTWGSLTAILKPFLPYEIFTISQIKQCRSSNTRQEFKSWYNKTFIHHRHCHQYLNYDNIDGPSCSCSHRPYKTFSARWSLIKAIAYTFNEYLYSHTYDITKCLAITKLADVIQHQWTIQQVEDYKKKYHIDLKVEDQFLFI